MIKNHIPKALQDIAWVNQGATAWKMSNKNNLQKSEFNHYAASFFFKGSKGRYQFKLQSPVTLPEQQKLMQHLLIIIQGGLETLQVS